MLVDINLLPEKETRSKSVLYILLVLILLAIILVVTNFILIQTKKSDLALLESKIKTAEQLRTALESSVENDESENSVEKLNEAVEWAESKRIRTVPVLQHLIELLPKRGFFRSFSYTSTENLKLEVQFDVNREAAFYLIELQSSKWIQSVRLLSVSTDELVKEGEKSNDDMKIKKDLPRYIAEYEISLKDTNIKKDEMKTVDTVDKERGEDQP
ncbi:type IV pilus assembly protein PilN [Oikeobacillus pervagus]|uniref:Type IV pilus assembly protein PilN n=1 Tax=Oikeobacillus pervagus TaxID=1325931 RepID=A0AAJ1WJY0_9BACI|nr:hypothetical protein [Oikeobacillus pervagus]MDQ0214546.1 type IV pilus assembly protein PilN [Oikeobacillus pervagus]